MAAHTDDGGVLSRAGGMRAWAEKDGEIRPPARVTHSSDGVVVRTVPKTDFWQTTSYGFVHDNGHFASIGSIEASLDGKWPSFEFTVGFEGEYESLYDQAGLMLRVDAHNWLKTGVEYVDGKRQASVVITRHGRSDWNVVPLDTTARASGATPPTVFWVRLRGGDDGSVAVYFCDTLKPSAAPATCPPREAFTLMRLANFVDATTAARARASQEVRLGVLCCSPVSDTGFNVRFVAATLATPAPDQALHGDEDVDVEAGFAASASAPASSSSSSSSSASASAAVPGVAHGGNTEDEWIAGQAGSLVSIMASETDVAADVATAAATTTTSSSSSSASSASAAATGGSAGVSMIGGPPQAPADAEVSLVADALMSMRVSKPP